MEHGEDPYDKNFGADPLEKLGRISTVKDGPPSRRNTTYYDQFYAMEAFSLGEEFGRTYFRAYFRAAGQPKKPKMSWQEILTEYGEGNMKEGERKMFQKVLEATYSKGIPFPREGKASKIRMQFVRGFWHAYSLLEEEYYSTVSVKKK